MGLPPSKHTLTDVTAKHHSEKGRLGIRKVHRDLLGQNIVLHIDGIWVSKIVTASCKRRRLVHAGSNQHAPRNVPVLRTSRGGNEARARPRVLCQLCAMVRTSGYFFELPPSPGGSYFSFHILSKRQPYPRVPPVKVVMNPPVRWIEREAEGYQVGGRILLRARSVTSLSTRSRLII